MIKLESIIINKNNFSNILEEEHNELKSNHLSFELVKDKYNFIHSSNEEKLDLVLSVLTGFYKPEMGNIIYDEYDLNKFNFYEKSLFINKHIGIINDFSFEDRNKTIIKYLTYYLVCLGINKKEIKNYIKDLIDKFDFENIKNTKIKDLTNNQILDFFILLSTINNKKYIFFANINKYIDWSKDGKCFLNKLKKNLKSNVIISFLVSKDIKINNIDNSKINIIDIDNQVNNEVIIIRNKKIKFKKEDKVKNAFLLFKFNLIENYKNFILILILLTMLNVLSFITYMAFQNKSINNTSELIIFTLTIILDLFFNIYFAYLFYKKCSNNIFYINKNGNNIFKTLTIFITIILLLIIPSTTIEIIFAILNYHKNVSLIEWTNLIFIFLSPYVFFISTFIIVYLYKYKNLFKKVSEI